MGSALRKVISLRFPGVRWIGTERLAQRMGAAADVPVVLLDARARREYDVSHLAGAIWVDPDAGVRDLEALTDDKLIVVYCSVGYRSAGWARRLAKAGFGAVSNLEGGIFRWANEGRPVYRGTERVDEVHPYDRVWGRVLRADLRSAR